LEKLAEARNSKEPEKKGDKGAQNPIHDEHSNSVVLQVLPSIVTERPSEIAHLCVCEKQFAGPRRTVPVPEIEYLVSESEASTLKQQPWNSDELDLK
jgi:hypothetical protein